VPLVSASFYSLLSCRYGRNFTAGDQPSRALLVPVRPRHTHLVLPFTRERLAAMRKNPLEREALATVETKIKV
jgi:hypothetical protein